jgi:hypothetical protein
MNEPGCGGLAQAMARLGSLFEGESHFERSVQFLKLGARQGPNEACQLHLAETYEVIA